MPSDREDERIKKLTDPAFRKSVDEQVENYKLFRRFQQAALDSVDELDKRTKHLPKDQQPRLGKAEMEILRKAQGVGVTEGLVATVVSFLFLRRGPVYFARYLRQRQLRKQGGSNGSTISGEYKLSDPKQKINPFEASANGNSASATNATPIKESLGTLRSRSPSFSVFWFFIDAALSLSVGASVSMHFTDLDKIKAELVDIPHVEGPSLVSDTFCHAIEAEMIRLEREHDPALERLREASQSMVTDTKTKNVPTKQMPPEYYFDGIQQFVYSCQRRRAMEHQLREERGLDPHAMVEIPTPGVDRNGPRLALETSDSDEKPRDDDNGPDSQWWMEGLVADQGEDQDGSKTW